MVNGGAFVFHVDPLGVEWRAELSGVVAVSRIVMFRDIEPDSSERCSGRCPWRDEQLCTLFFVQLVPVTGLPYETRCVRSDECVMSERRGAEWKRWANRAVEPNEA